MISPHSPRVGMAEGSTASDTLIEDPGKKVMGVTLLPDGLAQVPSSLYSPTPENTNVATPGSSNSNRTGPFAVAAILPPVSETVVALGEISMKQLSILKSWGSKVKVTVSPTSGSVGIIVTVGGVGPPA